MQIQNTGWDLDLEKCRLYYEIKKHHSWNHLALIKFKFRQIMLHKNIQIIDNLWLVRQDVSWSSCIPIFEQWHNAIRPSVCQWATNFTLGPIPKTIKFPYFYWPSFSQDIGPLATFKAVLLAVDMIKAHKTKCKTCFGGPRMILHAHWKKYFSKKAVWFFHYRRWSPPGMA